MKRRARKRGDVARRGALPALALLLLLMAGCGNVHRSPTDTCRAFAAALLAHNYHQAFGLLSDSDQQNLRIEMWVVVMEEQFGAVSGTVANVAVATPAAAPTAGQSLTCAVTIAPGNRQFPAVIFLRQFGGQWFPNL